MPKLGRKAAFLTLWSVVRGIRGGPPLGMRLSAVPRMLGATITGRYDGKGRLFGMVLALIYIISPIDLIPEAFFAFFGLADDAFVAVWLAGALLSETERFLVWEGRRAAARVVDAA
ncbi:MAG TPA: YkvA family protein [Rugosimonospora sp.]|nr:YkvA family protein [Rugosimonospora sp.]